MQERARGFSHERVAHFTDHDRDCLDATSYQAIKNWVGNDAAKYFQIGKNGQVALKGISAANFMKLRDGAAIAGSLIRSTSSTAALLSANVNDDDGRSTSAFTRLAQRVCFPRTILGCFRASTAVQGRRWIRR